MGTMTFTVLYWYISIGLIIGMIMGLIMRKEGVSMRGNIFFGVIGAILLGRIGAIMGLGDGLFFSAVALLPFLFLINVFHQHHEEDILGEIEHPAKVIPKKRVRPQ